MGVESGRWTGTQASAREPSEGAYPGRRHTSKARGNSECPQLAPSHTLTHFGLPVCEVTVLVGVRDFKDQRSEETSNVGCTGRIATPANHRNERCGRPIHQHMSAQDVATLDENPEWRLLLTAYHARQLASADGWVDRI